MAASQTSTISALITYLGHPDTTRTPHGLTFSIWFRSDGFNRIVAMKGAEFRKNDREELLLTTTGAGEFDRVLHTFTLLGPTNYLSESNSFEPYMALNDFVTGNFNGDDDPDLLAAAGGNPDTTKPQGAALSWIGVETSGPSTRSGWGYVAAANRKDQTTSGSQCSRSRPPISIATASSTPSVLAQPEISRSC